MSDLWVSPSMTGFTEGILHCCPLTQGRDAVVLGLADSQTADHTHKTVKERWVEPRLVTRTCDPSYVGGGKRESTSPGLAWAT